MVQTITVDYKEELGEESASPLNHRWATCLLTLG
jgi:hypothetical protein